MFKYIMSKHFRSFSCDTLKLDTIQDLDGNDLKLFERLDRIEQILIQSLDPINVSYQYIKNMSIDGLPVYIEKVDNQDPLLKYGDVVMLYYDNKKAKYNSVNDGVIYDLDYDNTGHDYFKFVSELGETGFIKSGDYMYLERVNQDGTKIDVNNHYFFTNGSSSTYANGISHIVNPDYYRIRVEREFKD